jgi:hypothetical protein
MPQKDSSHKVEGTECEQKNCIINAKMRNILSEQCDL